MNLSVLQNLETISWLGTILVLILQITVISVLGLLAAQMFRRDAATRHAVLCLALLSLVILPPLTVASRHLDWTAWRIALPSEISPPSTPADVWGKVERHPIELSPVKQIAGSAEVTLPSASHSSASPAAISTARKLTGPADLREPHWIVPASLNFLLQVWALGVLVLTARFVWGLVLIHRLRAKSIPFQNPTTDAVLEKMRPLFGGEPPPSILAHESIATAVATGIFRPAVILPRAYVETLAPDDLSAILTHELAHLVRRDPLVGLLQRLLAIIYWPHPLVHMLNRKLSRAREEICDNFVLQQQSSAGYAELLFRLVQAPPALAACSDLAPGWTISFLDPRWKLEDRIAGILDGGRHLAIGFRRAVFGVAGIVCLVVLLLLAGIRTATVAETAPFAIKSAPQDEYDALVELAAMQLTAHGDLFLRFHCLRHIQFLERRGFSGKEFIEQLRTQSREPVRDASLWFVPPKAWPLIGRLKSLQSLEIVASELPEEAWATIASLPRLRQVRINNAKSISAGVMQLKSLSNLESLSLDFSPLIHGSGLRRKVLGKLSESETAWVQEFRRGQGDWHEKISETAVFADRLLEQLSVLKNLQSISVWNGHISDRGVRALAAFPELKELEISFLKFTLDEARVMGTLSHLKGLRLSEVDDAMLIELCKLEDLEELRAWSGGVTDASIPELLKLTKLRQLGLNGNQLTDDGLQKLATLKHLERLDVPHAKRITPEGVREFRKMRPDCEVRFVQADFRDPTSIRR